MQDSTQQSSLWGHILKRAIKPLLIVIVILGIGQSVRLAYRDMRVAQARAYTRIVQLQQTLTTASKEDAVAIEAEIAKIEQTQRSVENIHWGIASWSIAFSFAALIPPAVYWWLTLRNFEHDVDFFSTLSIYSAGNLGKYVPGKAMVLVLRSGAMQQRGVQISTSIVSIFIETLSSLSVGGALGALSIASLDPPPWLMAAAMGAAVVALVPTIPPVFRRLLVVLTKYRHLRLPKKLATAMSWRLVGGGWLLFILAWLLMGSSLWIICEAIRDSIAIDVIDGENFSISSIKLWWICVAASCLGFVVGFLSMLPGGAGVREVVVTMLLAPAIGYAPALVAAVLYRVSNLIAELSMAGVALCIAKTSRTSG